MAATAGPRDVVLILDFSGSMTKAGRVDLMREAVNTVLETMTLSDSIAVVAFADDAEQVSQAVAWWPGRRAQWQAGTSMPCRDKYAVCTCELTQTFDGVVGWSG